MGPEDVRLSDELSERLARRAAQLLPLGSLLCDEHAPAPGEREALAELAERLRNTYPYPDPHYAGQMLKPPGRDRLGRLCHGDAAEPEQPRARRRAGDRRHGEGGGRASSPRCSASPSTSATSPPSGTIANLEALWVARELHPDACDRSRARTRTTRTRACAAVLGAPHETVAQDARGRMDLDALEPRLRARRRRHRRRDAGHDGARAPSTTSPRSPTCARSTARGCTSTRPTAASSRCSQTAASPASPPRRSTPIGAPTRSWSTRTSTASSPTAAAACCSPTRRRPPLHARLALHVLHLRRPAPGRDQPGVLARRRRGRRAVDDAARAAADARRSRAAPRGRPLRRRSSWRRPRCRRARDAPART